MGVYEDGQCGGVQRTDTKNVSFICYLHIYMQLSQLGDGSTGT